jgi:hypothetical protein
MRTEVVREFLDPQSDLRLAPEPAAILRTKLPALVARAEALIKSSPAATGTNAPPVAPEAPAPPVTTNTPPAR